MDSGLLSQLNAAIDQLASYTGDTVTLGSTVYNCLITGSRADGYSYEDGGTTLAKTAQIAIKQTDLVTEPAINSLVTFHGNVYRVNQVSDLTTTWQLLLVQQNA